MPPVNTSIGAGSGFTLEIDNSNGATISSITDANLKKVEKA